MLEKWKLTKSVFIILYIFALSTAAQTVEKANNPDISRVNAAKREESASKKENAVEETLKKDAREEENTSDEKTKEASPDSNDNNSAPPIKKYRLRRGEKEFSIEFGISPFNPSNFAGPKEYDVYGRKLIAPTIRFGRVIGTRGIVTYEYLFEVMPTALFLKNEVENPEHKATQKEGKKMKGTMRKTSYGVGVQPLNFRFIFFPDRRLRPFAQVGTGILITNKPIPVPYSRTLNFTGDFGGGVQYFLSRQRAVLFGYRYFHISNGNFGGKENNPGYNANVFYVSFSNFSF